MMIDDGLDDGVTALRQEARRQDPAIMVRAALLRRSCDRLGGKHVFQCFWSDPKTRVFECFSEVMYCFCHLACDGAAQTSSVALILRVASTTELMLLRRS